MELYDNCCVWVSHWEMIRYPGSVKARRVRRNFPKVYAGTVYTFCQLGDELTAFKGWTWRALSSGAAARHYSRPIAIFSTKEKMIAFVQWFKDWLNWALCYGQPWNGGSPIQIGWNGDINSRVRSTCELCDRLDGTYTGRPDVLACGDYRPGRGRPTPEAFGNLVWARVRGLTADPTQVSVALLDLEQITRQDGHAPYVRVMHAYPWLWLYSNEGVYAFNIVSVSDRAMRIISGR